MTKKNSKEEAATLQAQIEAIMEELTYGASPSRTKQLEYRLNTLRMQRSLLLDAENLRW